MKKYERIVNDIVGAVDSGKLLKNAKLPTEFELMANYGVSRITVQTAMNILKNEGVVKRKSGSGTFVTGEKNNLAKANSVALIICYSIKEIIRIVEGAERVLSENGINLSLKISGGDAETDYKLCRQAVEENYKGIIIFPAMESANQELYGELISKNFPLVFVDRKPPNLPCNFVKSNNFIGTQKICDLLIMNGHKKIAYISAGSFSVIDERINGYVYALKKHGLPIRDEYIANTAREAKRIDSDPTEIYRLTEQLVNLKEPPSAIIGCNDICAAFIIQKLKKLGYKVPADFSVCGFDNSEFSTKSGYDLTTVNQDFFEIGKTAAEILVSNIKGGQNTLTAKIITPEIIERKTVKNLLS